MPALPGNSTPAGQDRTTSFATVQTDEGGPTQNVRPELYRLCMITKVHTAPELHALPSKSPAGQDRTMSFATMQTDEGAPAQNVHHPCEFSASMVA